MQALLPSIMSRMSKLYPKQAPLTATMEPDISLPGILTKILAQQPKAKGIPAGWPSLALDADIATQSVRLEWQVWAAEPTCHAGSSAGDNDDQARLHSRGSCLSGALAVVGPKSGGDQLVTMTQPRHRGEDVASNTSNT